MRWTLVSLSLLSLLVTLFLIATLLGIGVRPWFGWWDSNALRAAPYTVRIVEPRAGGATERGGLRAGDLIDLREQSLATRIAVVSQLSATDPTIVTVQRGSQRSTHAIIGSTSWEGAVQWKLPAQVLHGACNALVRWMRVAPGLASVVSPRRAALDPCAALHHGASPRPALHRCAFGNTATCALCRCTHLLGHCSSVAIAAVVSLGTTVASAHGAYAGGNRVCRHRFSRRHRSRYRPGNALGRSVAVYVSCVAFARVDQRCNLCARNARCARFGPWLRPPTSGHARRGCCCRCQRRSSSRPSR